MQSVLAPAISHWIDAWHSTPRKYLENRFYPILSNFWKKKFFFEGKKLQNGRLKGKICKVIFQWPKNIFVAIFRGWTMKMWPNSWHTCPENCCKIIFHGFLWKKLNQLKTRENSTLTSPPGCEWNLHYTHFVVNSLLSTLCFLFSSTFLFCLFFLLLCGLCSVEWGNDKVFLFFFCFISPHTKITFNWSTAEQSRRKYYFLNTLIKRIFVCCFFALRYLSFWDYTIFWGFASERRRRRGLREMHGKNVEFLWLFFCKSCW